MPSTKGLLTLLKIAFRSSLLKNSSFSEHLERDLIYTPQLILF